MRLSEHRRACRGLPVVSLQQLGRAGETPDFKGQDTRVLLLVLSLVSSVTLDKSLSFSELSSPTCKMGLLKYLPCRLLCLGKCPVGKRHWPEGEVALQAPHCIPQPPPVMAGASPWRRPLSLTSLSWPPAPAWRSLCWPSSFQRWTFSCTRTNNTRGALGTPALLPSVPLALGRFQCKYLAHIMAGILKCTAVLSFIFLCLFSFILTALLICWILCIFS